MENNNFYPKLVRILIALLAIYLLMSGLTSAYNFASRTTDENLFRNPPSNLYVAGNFPATKLDRKDKPVADSATQDSIRVGDLLIAVNDHRIHQDFNLDQLLQSLPAESNLKLEILRTREDKKYTYLIAKTNFPNNFYRRLPVTVYVQEVEGGGASDMAGMQRGDLIYRINGLTFNNAREADRILRRSESGTTISYDIIRENQNITLAVTLAKFGIQISLLFLFLSGMVFWGVGTFIALNRPQVLAARLIGLSLMAFGYTFMIFFFAAGDQQTFFGVLSTLTVVSALPFGIAMSIHSTFYFPEKRQKMLESRWLTLIPYGLASLVVLLFLSILFQVFRGLEYQTVFILMFLSMWGYHLAIYFIYRKHRTSQSKKISGIISWASCLAAVAATAIVFFLNQAGQFQHLGFAGIPLVAIPLIYLYVIGHYQLLGMNLHVRRNITYIIVSSLWISVFVLLLLRALFALADTYIEIPNLHFTGTSIVVMDAPPDPRQRDFLEKLIIIFVSIGMTFGFIKLGKKIQGFINRKFNQDQYDLSRATSELAEVMATKLSMKELAQGVVEKLAQIMQLKRVGVIFFRDEKSCCCQQAYGFDGSQWDDICLTSGHVLVDEIQKFKNESRFSVEFLPTESKEEFGKHGFCHIIPIRFKDRLVGTFIVGEKLSESPLHLEDLTFLTTVAKQASLAIENTFLYEELTEQERLKHELEVARQIQLASLPQSTPQISGLDISGASIPALEVGGDYYDFLNSAAVFTVIVGDVSGKGTSAALYMSKIQGILRSLHEFNLSPRELFIRANQLLYKDLEKKSFITAIGASFDSSKQSLVLARAGHLPLFYYHAKSRQVKWLTPKGLGLGLQQSETFATELEEEVINYQPGDIFLFVTDGITEAETRNGEQFGEEKLSDILSAGSSLNANKLRDKILSEVALFAADTLPHDDQTVVVVKAL